MDRSTPSELSILSNFLLSPAALPTVIPLHKFTELFPKRLQSHPQIRILYRELQELRSQDMDRVSENILHEVRRGERQKAELRSALQTRGVDGLDAHDQREMDLDLQLFGSSSSASAGAANRTVECYTFADLVEEMERACVALEREIATTENDAEKTLEEMRKIVGELSDLRYGKLNKPGVTPDDYVTETVRGLKRLEEACDEAAARST